MMDIKAVQETLSIQSLGQQSGLRNRVWSDSRSIRQGSRQQLSVGARYPDACRVGRMGVASTLEGHIAPDCLPGADFPTADSLRTRWLEIEVEQRAFLEVVTAERLLSIVRYVNRQGQTWEYPLWREMYHVVNHSTYHRGQVAAMLRQLGARPVSTDFLVFHDEMESDVP